MTQMNRGELVSRTWRLVRLLESPKGSTLSELAEELGCSRRTVIRDLGGLQEAGLPIYDERDGREKRWKFVDGFRSRVPPPFTVTELLAMYFARQLARPLADTPFYPSLGEEIRDEAQAIVDRSERHGAIPGQLPLPIAHLLEELVLSSEPS